MKDRILELGKHSITGENYDLKYIVINQKGTIVFYPYLYDVYENEEKYPYLIKVFDSRKEGYQKFNVKVFEIDYKNFHQNSAENSK